MLHPDCTALVLCGGRSSRMGQDKAMMDLGGETLLARAVAFWQPLCAAVLLASGQADHFSAVPDGAWQVFDQEPGCGPLGGVAAGLTAAETDYLIVSAVDMPFLDAAAAQALLTACQGHDAAVYRLEGRPEPLFGVYCRTCLEAAQALLRQRQHKMRLLLDAVDTICLDTDKESLFFNVNTPDAFVQAQQQLEAQL